MPATGNALPAVGSVTLRVTSVTSVVRVLVLFCAHVHKLLQWLCRPFQERLEGRSTSPAAGATGEHGDRTTRQSEPLARRAC